MTVAATTDRLGPRPLRRLAPYPEYKDSGLDWLGHVPRHWQLKVLKRQFRVVNGSTPRSSEPENWDGDIPWITPDDLGKINSRVINEPGRRISRLGYESCGTRLVPAGSLILSTRAPIGHLAMAGMPVCTNQGCRSLVPRRRCDETYFYFLLRAGRPVLESRGQGSTFRELAKADLESVLLPVPPLDEQRAVSGFLDRETAKIDALVARKERLIELLQEKRAALITSAVTRGLDPNGPMKDSGVEWLGEIPAHWRLSALKRQFHIVSGSTPRSSEPENWDGDIPWITPDDLGKVNSSVICEPGRYISRVGYESCGTILVAAGSLILSTRAPIGHLAIAGMPVCTNQGCRSLVPRRRCDETYFYFLLLAGRPVLEGRGRGSTFRELAKEDLGSILLPIPPLDEQRGVSHFLARETAKTDALVAKIREAIHHLHEFRIVLISAAVSGKIDVREEAW